MSHHAAATASNTRLVVANDPDADRLAAAEQQVNVVADGSSGSSSSSGKFVTFSGELCSPSRLTIGLQ